MSFIENYDILVKKRKVYDYQTMKVRNYIYVLAIMIVVGMVTVLGNSTKKEDNIIKVALIESEGFSINSANPVVINKGEQVQFDISIHDNYFYRETEGIEYKDGKLIIDNVESSKNIYLDLGYICSIAVADTANGTVELIGDSKVPEGTKSSVRITSDDHYEIESIMINDKEYPPISGDVFEFSVEDDCIVKVNFIGEPVNFMCMSNNLGTVNVGNQVDEFHYGDVISLSCQMPEYINFKGWSTEGYLDEGGTLLVAYGKLDFTITEDTILYANFKDTSIFNVIFKGNQGKITGSLDIESSPNVYVNLPVNNGKITRTGYTLIGYNTKADGTGQSYQLGEMIIMPRSNMELYAMWMKNTDESSFKYTVSGGNIVINGLSDGTSIKDELCIPSSIDGKKVVAIADNAFAGLKSVETLVLPIGLETVGANAFGQCENLTRVYLPETLKSMDNTAFKGCDKFTHLRVLPSLGKAYDYDYDAILADKYMKLKYSTGKRIILVGGSNLTFGINSVMLKERFNDYDIVNFSGSYHYGVVTPFELIKSNVREGDVVIFIPEYYNTTYAEKEPQTITNWQYIESNYGILEDINIKNTPVLLQQYVTYLSRKRGILPGKLKNTDSVYIRSGINAYGDLITYRKPRARKDTVIPDISIITNAGMERYNNICKELTDKGVTCLFSFPSIHGGSDDRAYIEAKTESFMSTLKSKLNPEYCTIISECADYAFDVSLFYDNRYHLTLDGAKERTNVLIRDLEAYGLE